MEAKKKWSGKKKRAERKELSTQDPILIEKPLKKVKIKIFSGFFKTKIIYHSKLP